MTSKECLKRIDEKNYLTEREHKEFLSVVEKELKALEIIKEKRVDCKSLIECVDADEYNDLWFDIPIDKEEYELLKEVLENDK